MALTLGQAKALKALLDWHEEQDVEGVDGFAKYAYPHHYRWPAPKSQTGYQSVSRTVLDILRKAEFVEDEPYEKRRSWSWSSNPPVRITQAGVDAVNAFVFPAEKNEFVEPDVLPELVDIRTGERWRNSGKPGRVIGEMLYDAGQLRGDGKPKRGAWCERLGVTLGRGSYGSGEKAARGLAAPDPVRERVAASIRRRIKAAQDEREAAEQALYDLYTKGDASA